MAKTESTAVNELIDLVQSGKPLAAEPAGDLFSAPPPIRAVAPRVTSPMPRGAGDVAPLPLHRSPRATSQQAMLPPPIRMTTADPERGNTIPPLSQPVARASAPPPIPSRATGGVPVQRASSPPPIPSRATGAMPVARASVPPPIPTRASSPLPLPADPEPASSADVASAPPASVDSRALASTWTLDDVATPVARVSSFDDEHTPLPPASSFDVETTPIPQGDLETPLPIEVAPIETRRRDSAPAPAVAVSSELVDPPSAESLPPPPETSMSPVPPANLPPLPSANLPPLPTARPPAPFSASPAAPRPSGALPPPNRSSQPRASSPSFLSRPTVPSAPTLPPPTAPVAAPFKSRTDQHAVIPQGYPVIQRPRTIDATGDVVRAENWFELSTAVPTIDQTDGTAIVSRPQSETSRMIKRLILPAVLVGIAAGTFGAYLAVGNQKAAKKRAPVAAAAAEVHTMPVATPEPVAPLAPEVGAAQPEPPTKQEALAQEAAAEAPAAADVTATPGEVAEAPAPAEPAVAAPAPGEASAQAPAAEIATAPAAEPPAVAETPRGAVTFVDVRINSKPQGATVMLVDNGKTSFLGSTPLETSLDPSRRYDVIFTLPGRPTQMEPLDPAASTTLDVTLGGKATRHAKAAPAPASIERSVAEAPAPKAERKVAAPKVERVAPEKKVAAKAERNAAGEGTLMVSSKPPCEILIDGKKTGLTTPQRSIGLPAGTHKVTFINSSAGINKTVAVSIRADKPTKLIQDLMSR